MAAEQRRRDTYRPAAQLGLCTQTNPSSVIVKQDYSASGYGNVLFTADLDTPGLGVSDRQFIDPGITEDDVAALLTGFVPSKTLLIFSARSASLRRPACLSSVTTRHGVNRAAACGVGAARSTFAAARCARFGKATAPGDSSRVAGTAAGSSPAAEPRLLPDAAGRLR
jgi:hypothetical protein